MNQISNSFYRRNFQTIFELSLIGLITVQYLLGSGLSSRLGLWFYLLPGVIILLTVMPQLQRLRLLSGTYESLFSGHIIGGIFILSFTHIFSPYYLLLFMFLYISAYYHGKRGSVTSLAFIGAFLAYSAYTHREGVTHVYDSESILISVALFILMGLFLEHMIALDRAERHDVRGAHQEANLEHSRLQALVDSLQEACLSINHAGKILFHNAAAQDLIGGEATIRDQHLQELMPLKSDDETLIDLPAVLKKVNTAVQRDDLFFQSADGSRTALNITLSPVRETSTSDGSPDHFVMVIKNITAEKSLDDERNSFFAIASHELRTPLTAVRGNISMLSQFMGAKLNDEEREMIETAQQETDHLAEIVDEILLLAEAQRKLLPIELKMVEPAEVLSRLKDAYEPLAKVKSLQFTMQLNGDIHPVLSSEDTIYKILEKFVTNAIKFTDKGSVMVEAKNGEHGNIIFMVKDTGIGISKSDQNKLFHKFSQVEDFMTRKAGGTGLGLYTTTRLASRINAKVWVESKLNEGSTFYLQVPPQSYLASDASKATEVQLDHLVETL